MPSSRTASIGVYNPAVVGLGYYKVLLVILRLEAYYLASRLMLINYTNTRFKFLRSCTPAYAK
jgi:hypothetical protein